MIRRIRRRMRAMKTESGRGASLVIVVCVSAFLVAFSLAMVHTAGLMLSQANRRLNRERSYQLAGSFALALDRELEAHKGKDPNDPALEGSFYRFACRFLEESAYAVYDPDHPDTTVYHYKLTGDNPAGDNYGELTVALYKESDWPDNRIAGDFLYNDVSSGGQTPLEKVATEVEHCTFTVEVRAGVGGENYRYATVYDQKATYKDGAVTFQRGDGTRIWWDSSGWKDSANQPVAVGNGELISYEIDSGLTYLSSCIFTKAVPEHGETQNAGTGGETP